MRITQAYRRQAWRRPGRDILRRSGLATLLAMVIALPAAAKEPPFFRVDPGGTGPLTLAELHLHIPADIDAKLSPRARACIPGEVGRLAAQAGDPATVDPAKLGYMPNDDTWNKLGSGYRRIILAQAIISRAVTRCVDLASPLDAGGIPKQ